jgi:hypothetical protein
LLAVTCSDSEVFAVGAVPLKVWVWALKLSQDGSAAPLASLAL